MRFICLVDNFKSTNKSSSEFILIRRINDLKYNNNNHPNLGFTSDIVQILKKYNLLEYLDNFYDTGLFPSPTKAEPINKRQAHTTTCTT
jgi:hypothetical protein